MLRIFLLNHLLNFVSLEVLLLDVIVVRYALGCPHSNHEYVACQIISISLSAKVHRTYLFKVFLSQVDGIHLHAGTLEHLVLESHIGMVALSLGCIHESLQPVNVLSHSIQRIVLIIQKSQILPIEIHVNVIEVINLPGLFLKCPVMVNSLFDAGQRTV